MSSFDFYNFILNIANFVLKFWRKWEKIIKQVISCSRTEKTANDEGRLYLQVFNFETPNLDEADNHTGDHETVDDRVWRVVDQDRRHSVERKSYQN